MTTRKFRSRLATLGSRWVRVQIGALVGCLLVAHPAAAASEIVVARVSAVRLAHGLVVIAATLANRGNQDLEEVSLTLTLPRSAEFDYVLSYPGGSSFFVKRGSLKWRLARVPARSIVGPFAAQLLMEEEGALIRAKTRWQGPKRGSAKGVLDKIQDGTSAGASEFMAAPDYTKIPAGFFHYSLGAGLLFAAPLGTLDDPAQRVLSELPGTGMRFFVPRGDLGEVGVLRRKSNPPPGTADGLDWVGVFEVMKTTPGALLLEVPLRKPALPFELVRVFANHGSGYFEQPTLGTVTEEGLHATFAADGSSTYALGVDPVPTQVGVLSLGPSASVREGFDVGRGIESIFQDGYTEIFTFTQIRDSFMLLIRSQTEAGGAPSSSDFDGDGLSNREERQRGTQTGNPDSDGDGLNDGFEVNVTDTDPNDPDSDDDGMGDATEYIWQTNPNNPDSDGDLATDREEYDAGTNPNDPLEFPDVGFAPVPGCGNWGTCFSFEGLSELFYVTDVVMPETLGAVLRIPEHSPALLPRGEPPQGGTQEAGDLRSIVGTLGDAVFTVVPGGQRVKLDVRRPLLSEP